MGHGAQRPSLKLLSEQILQEEVQLRAGGGSAGHERQRKLGRMPVRERLARLLDPADSAGSEASFLEVGLWAAHGMYDEWGAIPAAGVVTGIGRIQGRPCMIVANDATVK